MCLDYIKMKLIVDTEKTKELSHDPTVPLLVYIKKTQTLV